MKQEKNLAIGKIAETKKSELHVGCETISVLKPKEIKPFEPKAEGMIVENMGYIPMKYIRSSKKFKNVNRPEGVCPIKVKEHQKRILNGTYHPEVHVPPTVKLDVRKDGSINRHKDGTPMYVLVTGGHRHMGHENADQDTFYCAIVRFEKTNGGRTALYNELIWQSNENSSKNEEVAKNVRTDAGIMNTVLQLVKLKEVSPTEECIVRALEDQMITKISDRGKNLKNRLMAKLDDKAETVWIYSSKDVRELEADETTRSVTAKAKTMKNQDGYDPTADLRIIPVIVNFLTSEFSTKYLKLFFYWTGLNADEIRDARVNKGNLLERLYNMCKVFVDKYESGEMKKRILLDHADQLESDSNYSVEKAA